MGRAYYTDASMLGCGAVCDGIRTRGLWSQAEHQHHISYLELLTATLAIRAFTTNKTNLHILGCVLHEPYGRNSLSTVEQAGNSVVPGEEPLSIGGTPSGGIQLYGRLRVEDNSILSRVAPGSENILPDSKALGECNVDLFAS